MQDKTNTLRPDFIIEPFNAITSTIKQGHFVLYKTLKEKHENRVRFKKSDLMYIYDNFGRNVSKRIMYESDTKLTDEQNCRNAMCWFDKAICILIKRGYLGLNFIVKVK